MLVIFPLLGIDAFEAASSQACTPAPGQYRPPGQDNESPDLTLRERGAEAREGHSDVAVPQASCLSHGPDSCPW